MSPKQEQLPGTGPARIPDIEKAAEVYRKWRDERMAAGKEESTAKKKLIELCQEHKVSVYDYEIEEQLKDGAKVKRPMTVELETPEPTLKVIAGEIEEPEPAD